MRGSWRLRKILSKVRQYISPSAVILTYHRVADPTCDPYSLAVSPANFAEQMSYINKTCKVLRLCDLGKAVCNRKIPRRAVAITFDDGYVDLLRNAHPILKKERLPATVFVPAGQIGSRREFWWDEIERIILLPETLPSSLILKIRERLHEWHITPFTDRDLLRKDIYKLLKPLDAPERLESLEKLAEWAGLKKNGRPDYRTMDKAELARLTADGLFEIGAHTVTHAALARLPESVQYSEITAGRDALAKMFNRPIPTFAYPYGGEEDFNGTTVEIARQAGFSLACTMIPGGVLPGDDLLRLNRFAVNDWPLDIFVRNLESFFCYKASTSPQM